MTGAQAIPSYQLLGDTDLKDREAVKGKLRAAGVNGVLVMRLAGVTERVSPVDGPIRRSTLLRLRRRGGLCAGVPRD